MEKEYFYCYFPLILLYIRWGSSTLLPKCSSPTQHFHVNPAFWLFEVISYFLLFFHFISNLGSTFCIGFGIYISITRTAISVRWITDLLATTSYCKNLMCSHKVLNKYYFTYSARIISKKYIMICTLFLGFCYFIWNFSFFCQFINLLDYWKYIACNVSFCHCQSHFQSKYFMNKARHDKSKRKHLRNYITSKALLIPFHSFLLPLLLWSLLQFKLAAIFCVNLTSQNDSKEQ